MNNNISRQPLFWLALVLGGIILSPILWYGLGMDQAVYAYGAWVWKVYHLPPYIGEWDHNYPGIFLVHRLEMALFGESILGFRIFDFILQLCALAMIYFFARRLTDSGGVAFVTCLAYALYYFGRGRWDAGQRDAFIFLCLLAGAFFCIAIERHPWLRAGLVGFFAGFAFLIRPTYGLTWLVFGAFILRGSDLKNWRRVLPQMLLFGFGCLAPALLVVLDYQRLGYLSELWRAIVTYNFEVYSRLGSAVGRKTGMFWFFSKLNHLLGPQPVFSLLGILSILLAFRRSQTGSSIFQIFALLFFLALVSLFSYLFMGEDLRYQLIPFWGLVILISSIGVRALGAMLENNLVDTPGKAAAWLFYSLILVTVYACVPPDWTAFAERHAYRGLHQAYLAGTGVEDQFLSEDHYAAADYLKTLLGPGDGVEVFSAHPLIPYLIQRKLPSRFGMVQQLMYGPAGKGISLMQKSWIREYTDAVIAEKPRFFVIADQGIYLQTPLSRPTIKTGLEELFPELWQFLGENYRPLKKVGRTEIYEYSPGAATSGQ